VTESKAIDVIEYTKTFDEFKGTTQNVAFDMAINALETVDKIANIIKIEQQPTSCEYTKLKSFEMIEKIITEYQLANCR
jgi:hypothetical protein